MMECGDLKLVYVKHVPMLHEEKFVYDLFFSQTPDVVWGVFWDELNPSICGDLTPEKTTYDCIKRIYSPYKLTTIQEISCLSMEHAINGIVALSWVDINVLDEYPESRMVFHFGDTINDIERKLLIYEINLEDYGN